MVTDMSMLSAQCDELRERAKELRSLAPDPNVPYLVPSTKEIMALAMASAASEMESAADTIWELRCKLAGMVDMRERARVAESENAKLRELVHDMYWDLVAEMPESLLEDRLAQMRELGVDR